MTSLKFAGRTLLSFFSFYAGWWACALGPSYGIPWLGPALMPLWIGLHLYFSPTALGESLFFVTVGAFGFVFDTALIQLGLFTVMPAGGLAPMWLVSMWILLALNFETMLIVRRRWWLVSLAGVMSGPLSYFFAEAVHAINYADPSWLSMGIHAVLWAILMPFLFIIRDWAIRLGIRLSPKS